MAAHARGSRQVFSFPIVLLLPMLLLLLVPGPRPAAAVSAHGDSPLVHSGHRHAMQQLVKYMNEMGVSKAGPHQLTRGRRALEEMRWWASGNAELSRRRQQEGVASAEGQESNSRRILIDSEKSEQQALLRGHTAGGTFRRRGGRLATLPFERANL